MNSPLASPRPSRWRYWLTLGAQLTVLLVGFELVARRWLADWPELRTDPAYGNLPLPHQRVVHLSEGHSRTRTNRLGHLDGEPPVPVPSDGILVVGDSFTEALQVDPDARFTNRVAAGLGRTVYNVGHSGWSPVNAIAFVRAELATFAPAVVVVQVSGNDAGDLFDRRRLRLLEDGAGFRIEPLRKPVALPAWRRLLARSALGENVFRAGVGLLAGGGDAPAGAPCEKVADRTRRALRWTVAELAATAVPVSLLYLPTLDYPAGCVDQCRNVRDEFATAATASGVGFIDTTDALCAQFARTRQPPHGFWNTKPGTGHLNATGHQVVAEVLTQALTAAPHR